MKIKYSITRLPDIDPKANILPTLWDYKALLLKELCAREPYHPMIHVFNDGYEGFQDGEFDTNLWFYHIDSFRFDRIEILPYLRPMSSMTEEEFQELHSICPHSTFNKTNISGWIIGIDGSEYGRISRIDEISKFIDWLNTHHFDYRGLIEKGLALEAPENMYK